VRTELGFRAPLPLRPTAPTAPAVPGVDAFDLHGLVTMGAPSWMGLDRQFGPYRTDAVADLAIEEMPATAGSATRWSGGIAPGRPPAALDGAGRRAELDVGAWLDDRAVIRVEKGFQPSAVFRRALVPALRARLAMRRGAALVRAAAYRLEGTTVAVAGWTGTGKTTVLIDALGRGAHYLGDDWVIVDEHGVVYPFTMSFAFGDRILLEHPELRKRLPAGSRVGFALRRAARGTVLRTTGAGGGATARGLRWMAEVGFGTSWHRSSFGDLLPEVPVGAPSRLDALVVLDPAPGDLARRLVSQVDFEYARDVAALRYFLSDDEAQILDRAHRAERHIVDAALKRVRVLARDDLRDCLPA
jgi:hypothetical protein